MSEPHDAIDLRDFLTNLGQGASEGQTPQPLHASIELTHRCNLACGHCYIPLTHERRQGAVGRVRMAMRSELPTQRWSTIFDDLAAAGVLSVLLTGGDPLLRRDFPLLYRQLRNSGMIVTVFTNGILISDEIADLFQQFPPAKVEVSLYGATEETYRRTTSIPGSWARTRAGLDRLKGRNIPFELKTVATRANRHELTAMREFALRYQGHFTFTTDVFPRSDRGGEPLTERLGAEEAARTKTEDQVHRKAYQRSASRIRSAEPGDELFGCSAGLRGFSISPAGRMHFCMLLRKFSFDLATMSFAEAWQEITQIRQMRRTRPSRCHQCPIRDVCVVCPARAYLETGDLERPSDTLCRDAHATATQLGRPIADWPEFIAGRHEAEQRQPLPV